MDTHKLKRLLQDHLSDGLVTVVGSGLSCAEGLPSMGALADRLEQRIEPLLSKSEKNEWLQVLPSIRVNGLEAALLASPPSSNLEVAIVRICGDYIREEEARVIRRVFDGGQTLRLSKLLKHLLKPSSGIPIVTTNYDRLIEVAAEEAGLGVDTMFVGQLLGALDERESRMSFCRNATLRNKRVSLEFQSRVNLFKPHGSLDWYERDGKPIRYSGDLSWPPLIITPGLNKYLGGYKSPFDRHREKANAAIDQAARFLVLGYGFNDQHLETHLEQQIRSGKPVLLLTRSLSPNASSLAKTHSNVLALEATTIDGVPGTRVVYGGVDFDFPNLSLWDAHHFATEVLGS